MPEQYPPLTKFDHTQFETFIAQEGYTTEGQIRRLKMIRPMIDERLHLREQELRDDLAGKRLTDEAIDLIIQRECLPLNFETIEVKGKPYAVVVEKSSLPPGEDPFYTVMMPQHVDTVWPDWPSFKPESLQRSPVDEKSGRITNLGVFDMGQGVLNAIAIMADVRLPPGMRLYTVFTRGEETPQSLGANAVINHWSGMSNVDLVLSSEIGPIHKDQQPTHPSDNAMRYIVARPGRVRVFSEVSLHDDVIGHASIPDLPNAKEEMNALSHLFMEIIRGKNAHGFEYGVDHQGNPRTSLLETHPLLGPAQFDVGYEWYPDRKQHVRTEEEDDDMSADFQGRDMNYSHPSKVRCKFYVRNVPPNDRVKAIETVKRVTAHIAHMRDWEKRRIKWKIEQFEGEESYSPFAMPGPDQNSAVRVTHDMLTRIAGQEAVPVIGHSVADENLYTQELLELLFERSGNGVTDIDPFIGSDSAVISVPSKGGKPHNPFEWLDWDDAARVRYAILRLLQDSDGYAQLMAMRRGK